MKFTKQQLKQIIKEELNIVLSEIESEYNIPEKPEPLIRDVID